MIDHSYQDDTPGDPFATGSTPLSSPMANFYNTPRFFVKRWARRSDTPSEIAGVQVISEHDSLAEMISAKISDHVEPEFSDRQVVSDHSTHVSVEQPRAKVRASAHKRWDYIGISCGYRP